MTNVYLSDISPEPRVAATAAPAAAPGRKTLVGIQLLRGVAAIMVVASHTNTMMGHPEYFGVRPFGLFLTGGFGVGIFFVISGFIIAYVTLDSSLRPKLTIGDYAFRRFARIVPFMWLCAIGYNVLSYLGTGTVEWLPALRALVLWPTGELKPNVLWSLRHELIFYILFALAMMGSRRRLWILLVWFAAPIVYGTLLILMPGLLRGDRDLTDLIRVVLLGSDFGANLQFAAGFGFAILLLRRAASMRERPAIPLAAALIAAILGTFLIERLALPMGPLRSAVWTILAGAIVWLGLVAPSRRSLLGRVGTVLGDASFSIYLVHNPVLLMLLKATQHLHGRIPAEALYLGFVLIAICAGIAVHYLVEAPLIARLGHGHPGPISVVQRESIGREPTTPVL